MRHDRSPRSSPRPCPPCPPSPFRPSRPPRPPRPPCWCLWSPARRSSIMLTGRSFSRTTMSSLIRPARRSDGPRRLVDLRQGDSVPSAAVAGLRTAVAVGDVRTGLETTACRSPGWIAGKEKGTYTVHNDIGLFSVHCSRFLMQLFRPDWFGKDTKLIRLLRLSPHLIGKLLEERSHYTNKVANLAKDKLKLRPLGLTS
jgi:hypothetical protein